MNTEEKLDMILENTTKILEMLSSKSTNTFHEPKEIIESEGNGFERLSKDSGLTSEELREMFQIYEDDIIILKDIPGSTPEKQLKASLLLLTFKRYLYNTTELEASELKKFLEKLAIGSLSILSANLKKYKSYIITKGKAGSNKYKYVITIPGLKKGIEIIKELSNQ